MRYVAFNVIIDDIVFPDGRTKMGVLGGGGPQAAFGMRLWSNSVSLVASAGSDFPPSARASLEALKINLDELNDQGMQTPRAWQVMEEDGRRTEIWRIPKYVIKASLGCDWTRVPIGLRNANAFHLCMEPLKPSYEFLEAVQAHGSVVSVETSELAARQVTQEELTRFVRCVDVFSPNIAEAESMLGHAAPEELIARFIDSGANLVALRMGAEGALVAEAKTNKMVHVPAVETSVVDPIGAGNAFCGGFLVGWCETGDLETAGMYGAVSASFLVEQIGLPLYSGELLEEAQRRLDAIRSKLEVCSLPSIER